MLGAGQFQPQAHRRPFLTLTADRVSLTLTPSPWAMNKAAWCMQYFRIPLRPDKSVEGPLTGQESAVVQTLQKMPNRRRPFMHAALSGGMERL